MASLIVQVDGKRVVFPVQEGRSSIGRHPDNTISLAQASVSGQHAELEFRHGEYFLRDVGSRNGTFVNKDRITDFVKLRHNDMLQFGDAVARFDDPSSVPAPAPTGPLGGTASNPAATSPSLDRPPAPSASPAASPSLAASRLAAPGLLGGRAPFSGTVDFADDREGDANITGQLASQGSTGGLTTNSEAKLKAVLEISRSLAGTVDLQAILPRILDTLFNIFPYADRGCILLQDERSGSMIPRAMKHRRQEEDATVRLSRTVVNKVLTDKIGILSADAASEFSGSESIADLKIRSMMCVPLLGINGDALGVLSIDSQNPLGQFSQEDLDILMTVAGQAALAYENARLMQVFSEKQKADNEMAIAKTIQRALLPESMPSVAGYQFYASYDAAQAVGGDYYDCFDLGDGKICLSFGDVAGKGVPGAIIMARMHSCVQSTIRHLHDVVEAITAINDHMCDTNVEGRFVTYILAIVDTRNHTVELANAGHMAPIIRRANGTVEQFNEDLVGTPIGVLEGYIYESEIRTLEPGDMVVLVTDGVDEAMNPAGEFYTGERVLQFVRDGIPEAETLGKSLLADVRRHANGRAQNDDITIMTFGRNPR
jgi:sigma-B regulation protein RsbU (phosphoserine phosphatase)